MNVFDIVGPIMIGPSSSHTAGAVKIGYFCHLLSSDAKEFSITFYGSFAKTYQGHCTDRAIIGGILGYLPNDTRIRNAILKSKELGYEMKIITSEEKPSHPNTAKIQWYENNHKFEVIGQSVGGGNIKIISICDQKTEITSSDDYYIIKNDSKNIIKHYTFKHIQDSYNNMVLVHKKEVTLDFLVENKLEFIDLKTRSNHGKI